MRNFKRIGPRSVTGPNPRGTRKDRRFPSPSKTVRGGSPPFHSSTNMLESSLAHATMWPPEGSCISIWRCCHVRPHALEEYHLTGSARGPSSLNPVLPEVATTLLPPIKDYVPGVTFEGTRDVRVVDCARTL